MIASPTAEKLNKGRSMPAQVGLYLIGEEISRGASAVFYHATNVTFQYKVALKVLHPALSEDEAVVRYFIAEGQDATRLIHPNIVRVYDAGLSDGYACIAQAYMDGLTITQTMRNRGRTFSLRELLPILEDVASALTFAHEQDWIHGNLKPTNVFLSKIGRAMVSDFRVASSVVSLRPANYPLGRTTYLSPEQRQGNMLLTPMSDVFSLALMVFEMLTGQLPYGVDDSSVVAPYIHGAMLLNVQVEEPQIRDDIASILNRALAVDPSYRYPSVAGFVQALAGAAQNRLDTLRLSEPGLTDPPSTTTALAIYKAAPLALASSVRAPAAMPRASKQERRNMSWISSVVGTVLIALLVLGVVNTMTLMTQSTAVIDAPDAQATNTVFYRWFEQGATLLNQFQIMQYFSPIYGLGAAVVLLVLLFQRELLRTFGADPESRYWRFLSYAIPPATIAFVLLLVLQIFHMVHAA